MTKRSQEKPDPPRQRYAEERGRAPEAAILASICPNDCFFRDICSPAWFNARVEIFPIDPEHRLFISPAIDDWEPLFALGITAIIDLDADMDQGVPTLPDHLMYLYFPIADAQLPNLDKLHAAAVMGARLVRSGHKVLSHCGMGLNRSALVAGLILIELGMPGKVSVDLLQSRRPGALYNDVFADYLRSL